MSVIKRRYDVSGGSLTVELETDHALDDDERAAFDRLDAACRRYAASGADDIDTAIDELGGEQGLTAG